MSGVKRYDPNYAAISNADDLAVEADNGIFVMASDYDRLAQECERLRSASEAQHARDSAELRRLCGERDNLRVSLKDADAGMMLFMEQRDAALKQVEALRAVLADAGNPLSNAAYNLAQKVGYTLTVYDCELLSKLRKRWDAALQAKP